MSEVHMTKAEMVARFVKRSAGLAKSLTEKAQEEYVDAAYRYGVATGLSGSLSEGLWTLAITDGTATYDYDDYVYEVRKGTRIGTTAIDEYTRKDQFEHDYSGTASEAKPCAVLYWGRTAKFYPTPDASYTVTVPARMLPTVTLPTEGINDHNHAMAVICEAVRELAADNKATQLKLESQGELDFYMTRLNRRSNSRARERAGGLSF